MIGAKWAEIVLSTKFWTVPAEGMKAAKEHRVPLCDRTLAILNGIKSNHNPDNFVFPGWKAGTGLSNGTMLALMKKMKLGHYTPQRCRSTFRNWAEDEAHTFQNETIELALTHMIKNQAEAAYRWGDQLERRRELMTAWIDYTELNFQPKE